jgi:hypothetical protein
VPIAAGRLLGEPSGTWRATTTSTSWDDVQKTPEGTAAAASLLGEVLAESYFAELMRWLEVRSGPRDRSG